MKRALAVLVFLLPFSAMSETGGDSGSDNKSATAGKMSEHKRAVRAVYWKGGYIILTADAKTELGEKRKEKPAAKPVTKK